MHVRFGRAPLRAPPARVCGLLRSRPRGAGGVAAVPPVPLALPAPPVPPAIIRL